MAEAPRLRVSILGCGLMGHKVAALLGDSRATLWGRTRPSQLPAALQALTWCNSIAEACAAAEVIFITVPIGAMRGVAREMGEVARGDQVVLFLARGVEDRFVLPHTLLREECCIRKIGVLGGPLHAYQPHQSQPTAVVVGSAYAEPAQVMRTLCRSGATYVYPTPDLVGVEVAGAIANVTSMAVGMAQQLRLGDVVCGLLLTRGLAEAAQLGAPLGASPQTFASLAGLGALIPAPAASPDRHLLLGAALARGEPYAKALQGMAGHLVDGPTTAAQALALAARHHFDVPLVAAVDAVIGGTQSAEQALQSVLHRGLDFGDAYVQRTAPAPQIESWV